MSKINFKKSFLTNRNISKLPTMLITIYCIYAIIITSLTTMLLSLLQVSDVMSTYYQIITLVLATTGFIYISSKKLTKRIIRVYKKYQTSTHSLQRANLELTTYSTMHSNEIQRYKAVENKHLEEVAFLSSHDPLTKLPNRILFTQRLTSYINSPLSKNKLTALIFIDLDGFKMINSTIGHDFADNLLIIVANRLKEHVQNPNNLCRLNGDDFIVLLSNIESLDMITNQVNKLIELVQKSWEFDNQSFNINANAGIAIFPDDANDTNTLIKMAEIAMQRSREQGAGRYQYYMDEMELNIAKTLRYGK